MSSRSEPTERIDRLLYVLFAHRADGRRHTRDREHHRGAALAVDFETYLARLYGLSWFVAISATAAAVVVGVAVSTSIPGAAGAVVAAVLPDGVVVPSVADRYVAFGVSVAVGIVAKRATVSAGSAYLRWRANSRRAAIERSLPGAVRYLSALAAGSEGQTAMLRSVAARDAYGETGTAFERVLEAAALSGSLDTGLRTAARRTPSREILSPFLLKFREHAGQGSDSLRAFLRREARMLSNQRSRTNRRARGHLKLLAKLFVVSLVGATALVIAVVGLGVGPSPSRTVPVPGRLTLRTALVLGGSAFALAVGASAAALMAGLRPSTYGRSYQRPTNRGLLSTATTNPASAALVLAGPAVLVGWLSWALGQSIEAALLFGYAAYGFPVGAVAVKRGQRDDARDRELRDFVHAVAGHVRLGKPFGAAVEAVAREIDFGPLGADIDDLAFRLGLVTAPTETDTRREALDRFAERLGTPLAEQTVGLLTGALDVGTDAETAFETLQTEVGVLYHQRKALQSAMSVYVTVGWLTALSVVALVAGLSALGGGDDIGRLYALAQSTMLACGWFAGVAAGGRYEALLHSAALVVVCHAAFAGAGVL